MFFSVYFLYYFFNFSTEIFFATLTIFVTICVIRHFRNENKYFPPGPIGLPIVGYLPFLTKNPHLKLQNLSKTYGDIFSIRLGSLKVIVLNSSEVITEAFSKSEFLGRPEQSIFSLMHVEKPFFMNGPIWYEQRQHALHILRTLQQGQLGINQHIQEEVISFVSSLEPGKTYDIEELITPAVSNCICALLFGHRYDYNDPERKNLDRIINNANRYIAQTSIFMAFPWLTIVPFLKTLLKLDIVTEAFNSLKDFVYSKIADHKRSLDPNNLQDFIDHYLYEMQLKHDRNEPTVSSEELLMGSIVALFGGASSTLRSTISWSFYVMATYPEIQKRVQKEIDTVIGSEKEITFADQKNMPYTQSVLMEIQRLQTVLPLGVLREAVTDVEFRGYVIPKGTVIIPNLWSAHHDDSTWQSANSFSNEQFLSEDGKSVLNPDSFLPFSHGKRSCPGKGFAIAALFVFFTSVLQKFTVVVRAQNLKLKGALGLTYHPSMPKAMFVPRSIPSTTGRS